MTRPKSIVRFEWLYLLAMTIGAVHAAVQWSALVARSSPGMVMITQSLTFGLTLLLVLLVSRRQSGIARVILVGAFAIGLPVGADLIASGALGAGTWIIAVQFVLQFAALFFLFTPQSREWVSGRWEAPAAD